MKTIDTFAFNPYIADALSMSSATEGPAMDDVWVPFLMSLGAGLATTLGGSVIFCVSPKRGVPPYLMAFVIALASGVMIAVSLLELIVPAILEQSGDALRIIVFVGLGMAAAALLGRLLPQADEGGGGELLPTSAPPLSDGGDDAAEAKRKQHRLGLLMMIALTAHNLPEGLAVAVTTSASRHSGGIVAVAIAMHNIPEGLAIAVPVFAATRSRRRALLLTLASGLSEPLGALIGLALLRPLGLSASGVEYIKVGWR